MFDGGKSRISVIIPAYNEENAVGKVIDDIPKSLVDEIIVVNNNSNDNTSRVAELAGAIVLNEPIAGYGRACLSGMEYLKNKDVKPEVVVFIDADYSDYPEQMIDLVEPIIKDESDLVIGSRALGDRESGSMTFPQRFGNWLATFLIKIIYGYQFTDLGPFRAIQFDSLLALNMQDKTFGWTVEMQVKAIKNDLRCKEIPVNYRNRIGFSKISGTLKGTLLAGYKIIGTIFKYL